MAAEVCRSVTLLRRLAPDVLAAVEQERDATCLRQLSLRRLGELARSRDHDHQRRIFVLLGAPQRARCRREAAGERTCQILSDWLPRRRRA
jgi:hypothetical protein